MKVLFESDRECTINGVGLLSPGEPVEVDPMTFEMIQGCKPAMANLPNWVKVTFDVTEGGE